MKTVVPASISQPPGWSDISRLLKAHGAELYALFGGAIRDTDLGVPVNDYDVRVWMNLDDSLRFLNSLKQSVNIRETPSAGTGRIRYCFIWNGYAVDLSIRPIPLDCSSALEVVAIERAGDSDAGLCSVAMDPNGQGFATTEYLVDKAEKTITMYPGIDSGRLEAYSSRMQEKFPEHTVIWRK